MNTSQKLNTSVTHTMHIGDGRYDSKKEYPIEYKPEYEIYKENN